MVITLERTPCYGFCPVYKLTIGGHGTVVYEGKDFVSIRNREETTISRDEIDQLVADIETDYNGFKQEMAEKGVVISKPPEGGGQAGDKVTIDDYLADKFPEEVKSK